jgi:hypothetical protein
MLKQYNCVVNIKKFTKYMQFSNNKKQVEVKCQQQEFKICIKSVPMRK